MPDMEEIPVESVLANHSEGDVPIDAQALALLMQKLARSYGQQKITRSLYRRQRKVIMDYFKGDLSSFPELCFNEFSQHACEPSEASADGVLSKLFRRESNSNQGAQKNSMVGFFSLLLGGLIGILFILFFG